MDKLLKFEPYILKAIKISNIISYLLMFISITLLYIYNTFYISEILYLSSIELFKAGILINLLIFVFNIYSEKLTQN